ncbi:MAG: hypothetical protein D3903_17455 [Candidatus Electrothrix sp. GM3_4]|nr:hypothetical protein [Candidatus Electrothrix sp. GM3_4]
MKLLKEKGLHGSGLIQISSTQMIERYNSALISMGFKPTGLDRFSVDMFGWSPEVATEKRTLYYLTHSLANPMGIIISIHQRHAPVYFPYHSFDRAMISSFFDRFTAEIMDITTTDALCIDLENGVSTYAGIEDLLLVDSFILRAETPHGLIAEAQKQQQLIAEFQDSDVLWEDQNARQDLISSAKKHGDLRQRKMRIADFSYPNIEIFYTEVMGGIYILKHPADEKQPVFVVCKKPDRLNCADMDDADIQILPIDRKNLLRDLRKADFFQLDMKVYQNNPELLEYKKELLLANFICEQEQSYSGWNEMRKKNFIARHAQEIPPLFFTIERLQKCFAAGKQFYDIPLSVELINYLTIPHERMPAIYWPALENLLSELDPSDPVRLFKYNKKRFYQEYKKYPPCKKQWVAELVELGTGG